MKTTLYFLLASFALAGCEKNDDKPASLVGSWSRAEMYSVDNSGNRSHNLLEYLPECEKDDLYQFTENNDFFLKEGSKVCNPSSARTDKYELLENSTRIKFQNGGIWEISSLSKSSFKATQPTAPMSGAREVVIVFHKK